MAKAGQVRIGTSGWNYKHWRGPFYPAKLPVSRWFHYYGQQFDTVEVNNTFYRLPAVEVFRTWREQAPAGFLYAIKASRFLTHMKKLKDPAPALERILGRARELGAHLGPVLYQLPPHWRLNVERLREFLAVVPFDIRHVFEFRNSSWCVEEVRALLDEAGAGYCIHDMRGYVCPAWVTGPLAYIRFHGPTELRYAGCYGKPELCAWADRIRKIRETGRDVFVYFNNDDAGHAVTNARQLRELLHLAPVHQGK